MIKDFSVLDSVQTDSGPHLASYAMGVAGSFMVDRWPECEADHSLPPGAENKNGGAIPPFLNMSSCHTTLLIKHRHDCAFTGSL